VDRLWPVTSYLLTNVTATLVGAFFFVLNRTTVVGRENVGNDRNTLLCSNHQSMIDILLVGIAAYHPRSWWRPYLLPWNPAAAENFFRNPLLAWLSHNYRCIPVREGRRDPYALRRMIDVLPRGVMTLFPEGTRSRDGSVRAGRPGTGYLILATRPKVIPVAIDGMQDVLPIGRCVPRVFKRVYVSYGAPVDFAEFLDRPRNRETAQAVVDRVMERIRAQHAEIRRLREGHRAD
jgi:1-acyl-sn-glycerol-3-phosphate acyltransferase